MATKHSHLSGQPLVVRLRFADHLFAVPRIDLAIGVRQRLITGPTVPVQIERRHIDRGYFRQLCVRVAKSVSVVASAATVPPATAARPNFIASTIAINRLVVFVEITTGAVTTVTIRPATVRRVQLRAHVRRRIQIAKLDSFCSCLLRHNNTAILTESAYTPARPWRPSDTCIRPTPTTHLPPSPARCNAVFGRWCPRC